MVPVEAGAGPRTSRRLDPNKPTGPMTSQEDTRRVKLLIKEKLLREAREAVKNGKVTKLLLFNNLI